MGKSKKPSDGFQCSHVLQKIGMLKNFTVAKIIHQREIEDLKQLIKLASSDKKEYERLLKDEISHMANMHDPKNPIPGILYNKDGDETDANDIKDFAKDLSDEICDVIEEKKERCILIARIIKNLGLTKEDFLALANDDSEEEEEPYKDSGEEDDD